MSTGAQSLFYKSKAWVDCREGYLKSVGGLCENCMKKGLYNPAIIVHHKEHITLDNINNPEITLNYANLKAVCRDCHAKEHADPRKRYRVDMNTGDMIILND